MANLDDFDINGVGNPNNNVFGLPFTEEESKVVIVPVPWEVTVSFGTGTARATEHIFNASLQVDLYDPENPNGWKNGFYMREADKAILLKSDFLRKEAELYINSLCQEEDVENNKFMCKSLRDVNEGSKAMNNYVYEQTKAILDKGQYVGLLGGDHSTPLGYWKALADKYPDFGILQIDAHCDLRVAYENFKYSHASVAYNGLEEIPQISKLVQVGIRDYSIGELEYIQSKPDRIKTYFDKDIKEQQYEGASWKQICEEIVSHLPQNVHISFDIDGLDPKLCPNTGTPVQGGFEAEQINYLFSTVKKSGRKIIGFDLVEVGVGGENDWDANVGARVLWKLCNLLV